MMSYIVFKPSEGKWDMVKDRATKVDQARDEGVIKASTEASGSYVEQLVESIANFTDGDTYEKQIMEPLRICARTRPNVKNKLCERLQELIQAKQN